MFLQEPGINFILVQQAAFQSLAHAARIQKSYLSKVVTGRADLTTDQLYLICRHLDLDPEAARYLELLLERERSGVAERREELR